VRGRHARDVETVVDRHVVDCYGWLALGDVIILALANESIFLNFVLMSTQNSCLFLDAVLICFFFIIFFFITCFFFFTLF